MDDNIYVYLVDKIPGDQHSMVTPCNNGYTILIDARLSCDERLRRYEHELQHIKNGDFDVDNIKDVQEIEATAHGITPDFVVPGNKWQEELERIREKNKKTKAALARKEKQIKRKVKRGYDFFSAAEREWLEPKI